MKLEFDDITRFLSGRSTYEPPEREDKLANLNVIMAAVVAVRVYDEMRRKASIRFSDAIKDAVDSVGEMDPKKCALACLSILHELANGRAKTAPIDMKTAHVLIMSLVDYGTVMPPEGFDKEDLDKSIQANRMILITMANKLSDVEKKREDDGESAVVKAPSN